MHKLRRSTEGGDVVALRVSKGNQMFVDVERQRGGAAEDAQPAAVGGANHGVAVVGIEGQDPVIASAQSEAQLQFSVVAAVGVQDADLLELRSIRFTLVPALDDGQVAVAHGCVSDGV